MSNTLKDLALSSLGEELDALEAQKRSLLSARNQLETMTDEQIAAVVSISNLYQKLIHTQRKNIPGNPMSRRPFP